MASKGLRDTWLLPSRGFSLQRGRQKTKANKAIANWDKGSEGNKQG